MPKAVIMAGGQGERFWPLTHARFPKYHMKVDGKRSLLQKTYERLSRIYRPQDIYVITTREHVSFIQKDLSNLKKANILTEPFRNNTASAILFSCAWIGQNFGGQEIVSFFPADHLIQNEASFKKTMQHAIQLASKKGMLVTIGIQPTFPATGYGYLESGPSIPGFALAFKVKRFKEKPTRRVAQYYLKSKRALWNGGIFTWKIQTFMNSLKKFSPDLLFGFELNALPQSYRRLPKISIDYALLEKADNLAIVKTDMDWCDMGSWDMFLEKVSRDKNQNWIHGNTHLKESSHSLVVNHQDAPLVALGVRNLIVVQTEYGTLICPRTRSEEAAMLLKK